MNSTEAPIEMINWRRILAQKKAIRTYRPIPGYKEKSPFGGWRDRGPEKDWVDCKQTDKRRAGCVCTRSKPCFCKAYKWTEGCIWRSKLSSWNFRYFHSHNYWSRITSLFGRSLYQFIVVISIILPVIYHCPIGGKGIKLKKNRAHAHKSRRKIWWKRCRCSDLCLEEKNC